MKPTGSDVGSLFPFIQQQAARGEFQLSYLRDTFDDLRTWKRKARGKLLELLHYTPARVAPNPEVLEIVDCGDYLREKITFQTTPDLRVPAYVLVPRNARRPLPAVINLHDHGGFYFWGKEKLVALPDEHPVLTALRQRYYAGRSTAIELVRQGYLTIVIDMFYWGERRMVLDDDPEDWRTRPRDISPERIAAFNQRASEYEALVGRTIYAAGFTWPGVLFWDDLRTVDYLISRPDVDRRRIGCVGLSVGGLRACHLAALDSRIRVAVVVGWMTSFPAQLKRHIRNTIGHTKVVPGLYRYLDYPDVAALAMPAAMLVINGSRDALFDPDGVKASFEKLQRCYQKAGIPEKLRTRLYDAPHEFNVAMQADAWDWLRRWL
ncbi:MAG: alpha/beta hydrolase family protein [Chloroherpetonaceae bacterium]|nr:alpha/beta hydrolase family protein [Chthonomonadaceae bacterium]MDW8208521.1 alpha/beta hydrolase family protein [Chloroherpetonaceae bacterium]